MKRNLVRSALFTFAALALIGSTLLTIRIAVHADANQRVALSGNTVPLVQKAQLLQTTDSNQQLNLSIGLQLRNSAELDSLLSAIYNPNSPHYHDYLTPDQFNMLFAPTSDQVQQVVSYLQSQSLTVTNIAPNNLLIDATGNVAQVQQAFNLQINNYQVDNHVFYSNASAPSVPISISQLITSISGLDNSVQYQPLYQRAQHVTSLASRARASLAPTGCGQCDYRERREARWQHWRLWHPFCRVSRRPGGASTRHWKDRVATSTKSCTNACPSQKNSPG